MANQKHPAKDTTNPAAAEPPTIVPFRIEDVRLRQVHWPRTNKPDFSEVRMCPPQTHSELDSVLSLSDATFESWGSDPEFDPDPEIFERKDSDLLHHAASAKNRNSKKGNKFPKNKPVGSLQNNGGLATVNSDANPPAKMKSQVEVLVRFKNTESGRYWKQWVAKFDIPNQETVKIEEWKQSKKENAQHTQTAKNNPKKPKCKTIELVQALLAEMMSETKKRSVYCQTKTEFELFRNKMKLLGAFAHFNNFLLKGLPPVWFFTELEFWPLTRKEREYHGAIMTFHNRFLKDYYDESDLIFGPKMGKKKVLLAYKNKKIEKKTSNFVLKHTISEKVDFRTEERLRNDEEGKEKDQKHMNDDEFWNHIGFSNRKEQVERSYESSESESESGVFVGESQDSQTYQHESENQDDSLKDSLGRHHLPQPGKEQNLSNLFSDATQCQNSWGQPNKPKPAGQPRMKLKAGQKHHIEDDQMGHTLFQGLSDNSKTFDKKILSPKMRIQEASQIELTESNEASNEILLISGGRDREVQIGKIFEKTKTNKEPKKSPVSKTEQVTDFGELCQKPVRTVAKKKRNLWKSQNRKNKRQNKLGLTRPKKDHFIENEMDEKLDLEIELEIEHDHTPNSQVIQAKHIKPEDQIQFGISQSESQIELEIEEDEVLSLSDESNTKLPPRPPVTPLDFQKISQLRAPTKTPATIKKQFSTKSDVSFSVDKAKLMVPEFSEDSLQHMANMEPGDIERAFEKRLITQIEDYKDPIQTEDIKNKNKSSKGQSLIEVNNKNQPTYKETKKDQEVAWHRPESICQSISIHPSHPELTRPTKTKPHNPMPKQTFKFTRPEQAHRVFSEIHQIGESSMNTMSRCQNDILQRLSKTFLCGKRGSLSDESSYMLGVIEKTLYQLRSHRASLKNIGLGTLHPN